MDDTPSEGILDGLRVLDHRIGGRYSDLAMLGRDVENPAGV